MNIKLIALDLDGTLLDSKKNMPKDFIEWVSNHKNIRTVIASGRQYYTILRDFPTGREHLTIIAENGGLVFDENGQMVYINEISKEDVKSSLDRVLAIPGAVPVLCGEQSAYIPHVTEGVYGQTCVYYARIQQVDNIYDYIEKDRIIKIAIFFDDGMAAKHILRLQNLDGNVISVLSGEKWIDIANNNVNKGTAIKHLLKTYSINRSDAMAFGDYLNDTEMLEACEESYCMENGHPDLKLKAKHIAPSNDDNGVMKVLYQVDNAH